MVMHNDLIKKIEISLEIMSYEKDCHNGLTLLQFLDWSLEDLQKRATFLNEAYGVGCKSDMTEEEKCLMCFELLIPEKMITI